MSNEFIIVGPNNEFDLEILEVAISSVEVGHMVDGYAIWS